jgi:5-methylcytosine-specific restriction enzyme A
MHSKPPRLCGLCGRVHPIDVLCSHQVEQQRARKARHDHKRPSARERGYDTEWDKARLAFLREFPLCKRCGGSATVVDHVIAHRGNRSLFWNRWNWQALCAGCHNGHKQRLERRAQKGEGRREVRRPSCLPVGLEPTTSQLTRPALYPVELREQQQSHRLQQGHFQVPRRSERP